MPELRLAGYKRGMITVMDLKVDFLELFSGAMKICKEQEYHELQDKIHQSYLELLKAEAKARRVKASALIKSIQTIDRELKILLFEYGRVKSKYHLDKIVAVDQYIAGLEKVRKGLVLEKERLS